MPVHLPLSFGPPFHSGHHSPLTRLPCATQHVPVSYLFHTWYQSCVCVHPCLPMPLSSPLPLGVRTFVLYICVSLYFHFANRIISTIFLDSTCMCLNAIFFFLFLIYFTLYFLIYCVTLFRSIHISTDDPILFLFV